MKTRNGKAYLCAAAYALLFAGSAQLSADESEAIENTIELTHDTIEQAPLDLDRDIYLETQLGEGPGSDYVVLLPPDQYSLNRQVVGSDSVLYSHDSSEEEAFPYRSNSGFVLVRTRNDRAFHRGAEEIFRSIKTFLEEQSLWGSVFFLDTKFIRSSESLTRCEGSLYRPGTGEGVFFLEKRKPKTDGYQSGGSQAYYLLSYSFEGDHDTAEQEFRSIADCIYQAKNGQLVKLPEE